MDTAKAMMTPGEVAAKLGVSRRVITTWCSRGMLKHARLGARLVRVSHEDLELFVRERSKKAARKAKAK